MAKKAKKSPVKTAEQLLKMDQKKALEELKKLKKRYTQVEKKAKGFVKKNPGKSLLIATGVGAALGAGVAALVKSKKKAPKKKAPKRKAAKKKAPKRKAARKPAKRKAAKRRKKH